MLLRGSWGHSLERAGQVPESRANEPQGLIPLARYCLLHPLYPVFLPVRIWDSPRRLSFSRDSRAGLTPGRSEKVGCTPARCGVTVPSGKSRAWFQRVMELGEKHSGKQRTCRLQRCLRVPHTRTGALSSLAVSALTRQLRTHRNQNLVV